VVSIATGPGCKASISRRVFCDISDVALALKEVSRSLASTSAMFSYDSLGEDEAETEFSSEGRVSVFCT